MMEHLKQLPVWCALSGLFVILLAGYYIRPDNVTEDALKSVLGALLLSLQVKPRPQDPPV